MIDANIPVLSVKPSFFGSYGFYPSLSCLNHQLLQWLINSIVHYRSLQWLINSIVNLSLKHIKTPYISIKPPLNDVKWPLNPPRCHPIVPSRSPSSPHKDGAFHALCGIFIALDFRNGSSTWAKRKLGCWQDYYGIYSDFMVFYSGSMRFIMM